LKHFRWVHNNDVVTRVPPPWMGYRHGGEEIYLDRFGRIRKITGVLRSRDRWHGFVGGLLKGSLDPLADHSIHLYAGHIGAAVDEEERRVRAGGTAAASGGSFTVASGGSSTIGEEPKAPESDLQAPAAR
jgi:triacylglycerol lipase